jgi:hypothetical protein
VDGSDVADGPGVDACDVAPVGSGGSADELLQAAIVTSTAHTAIRDISRIEGDPSPWRPARRAPGAS